MTFDTKNGYERPLCATENHGTHTRAMLYCLMAFKEALHHVINALLSICLMRGQGRSICALLCSSHFLHPRHCTGLCIMQTSELFRNYSHECCWY